MQYAAGPVQELHAGAYELVGRSGGAGPVERVVRPAQPAGPALVLGSGQSDQLVDREACARAGVQVVRRRSGGGAVLVEAGSLLWVDVVVPAGDPLWCDDVGRSAWWLGEAWVAALGAAGVTGAEVWKGGMVHRPWSSLVCFAGLGPGEVTAGGTGKMVGISQRRSRSAALFQCGCLLRWEPRRLLELLALGPPEREEAARALAGAAAAAGPGRGDEVLGHFLEALP